MNMNSKTLPPISPQVAVERLQQAGGAIVFANTTSQMKEVKREIAEKARVEPEQLRKPVTI